MKKMMTCASLLAATMFLSAPQNALAATPLTYYSYNEPGAFNSEYGDTEFSNTDGTVVVNGWQTNDRQQAKVYYYVVTWGFFNDTQHGSTLIIEGNYQQGGTWFSGTITNVPAGSGYDLKIASNIAGHNQGAGNAY